jgi:hypothetical protein
MRWTTPKGVELVGNGITNSEGYESVDAIYA